MRALIIATVLCVGGCCAFCKRATAPPIQIVKVRSDCLSTPPPVPSGIGRVKDGCPEGLSCYDAASAVRLGNWIEEIAEWSRDAWTLCGPREEMIDETNNDFE